MQLQNLALNTDLLSQLPEELEYHVLSYLEPKDLSRCESVCKRWQRLASDENLWKNLIPESFLLQNKTIKQAVIEYNQHSVYSIDELTERITKFASKIPTDQIAEMRCAFPLHPVYSFKVKFGHGQVTMTGDAQVHEYCIMRQDTPRDYFAFFKSCYDIEFPLRSKHFVKAEVHLNDIPLDIGKEPAIYSKNML
jgi:hypothetical protein